MPDVLDSLLGPNALGLIGAAVGGLVVLMFLFRVVFGRKKNVDPLIETKHLVDLSEIPLPEDGPYGLRVQNLPGKLGVVVFAPLGKIKPPAADETFAVLNTVVPGLGKMARRDNPIVQTWSNQVSVTGFANTLARHLMVPGRDLTDTPWCLLVGKLKRPEGLMVVGLAIGMEAPNNLGVIRLNDETQWLQFLQVNARAD
ncbi:MAG: hypothetical protein ISQ07_02360 [Pirellulales bacterium]|jgi:hypothetical protein|nr:hypothetical protein [Pirellulales bacterium]